MRKEYKGLANFWNKTRTMPKCFFSWVFCLLYEDIREKIEVVFQRRASTSSPALTKFLDNTKITDHLSMRISFRQFANFLDHHHNGQKVVLIITENQTIPFPNKRASLTRNPFVVSQFIARLYADTSLDSKISIMQLYFLDLVLPDSRSW